VEGVEDVVVGGDGEEEREYLTEWVEGVEDVVVGGDFVGRCRFEVECKEVLEVVLVDGLLEVDVLVEGEVWGL
jgi:hypothetical protein